MQLQCNFHFHQNRCLLINDARQHPSHRERRPPRLKLSKVSMRWPKLMQQEHGFTLGGEGNHSTSMHVMSGACEAAQSSTSPWSGRKGMRE